MKKEWLIYGAYGYTGNLLANEAVRAGHKPVLAGRSQEKLISLSEKLDLDYRTFDLENEKTIIENIQDFDLIFLAAGPFKHTSAPIIQSCLKTGTNYLDITGEVPVFEQNFKLDQRAKEQGIVILSGVGFDVVPSDCMAKYVSEKIRNPTILELGIGGMSESSPGTLKTMLEYRDTKALIRKNGQLVQEIPNNVLRKIRFTDKVRYVMPVMWGDLATAYRSTGIPNITTYMEIPKKFMSLTTPIKALKNNSIKNGVLNKAEYKKNIQKWIDENVKGPDENTRLKARSYVWARARNDDGSEAQAWLNSIEPYQFTVISGIKCVEKVFKLNLKGTLTPSLAFGKDFVLEFPETKRYDSLNE
ncbi:MAG TPA: saccharopine dehydrogenase NADP-binding domain-containing protein [Candidatus Lokiarchaeia archaeon]